MPYPLGLESLAQLQVVGEGSHGDGELAKDLEVNGSTVCVGDECVHPPVCAFGQQVDERLEESDAQVLKVLWGLDLSGVLEADVSLQHKTNT